MKWNPAFFSSEVTYSSVSFISGGGPMGVDIDRVYFGGVHGEAAREISGAFADVGDNVRWFEVEGGENFVGLLPCVSG